MDLTKFTSQKKEKKTILVDNENITIYTIDNQYYFTIKTKKGLQDYQNSLLFAPTHSIITDNEEEAQQFFEQSLSEGVEGVMVKSLTSPYVSGMRSGSMTKLKETNEDLDVVILAAEHGKGKRAGYYSSFYVGVINHEGVDEEDKYLLVGKVSSGIKELENEEQSGVSMQKLTELLKPYKLSEENNITYFEPQIIIQVRYQEIQQSTTYSSGYALRFPRIIMLRDDKPLEEINSLNDLDILA